MSWLATLSGVLLIGNSLFGQTNPDMLAAVLQSRAPGIPVAAQIINGAPLQYNWSHSDSAEGVDARAELPKGGYNAVILTEAVPLANHLQWSDTNAAALRFYQLATDARPDTRVFLQETWHSRLSGTGVEIPHDQHADIPWRQRLDRDLAAWESIVESVNAAVDGNAPDMALIPAGQAMARLADQIGAGLVPGLASVGDVFDDDIHLNPFGFYFVTMVQFAVLTGENPTGLPHALKDRWGKAFDPIAPALARRLQGIAWDAVQVYQGGQSSPGAGAPGKQPDTGKTIAVADAAVGGSAAPMAIGLAGINDWSVQQPFLDVMKTARPWIGHRPGRWGGVEYAELLRTGLLDAYGWPMRIPRHLGSIGTLILTDLPEQAVSLTGRYRLRFEGRGIVEVAGRASNVRYGKGEVTFDFAPGPGSVDIRIQRSDPAGDGDHVRNISVVKLARAGAYDSGAVFNPDWLARIRGFRVVRLMDWMATNDSTQSQWENRPKVSDFSWAVKGVPLEIMLALSQEIDVDVWFNMPHLADDDYVRRFAMQVQKHLPQGRQAYVEFSNEVWNWQFDQTRWADAQALARWGAKDAGMQYYGVRAAEVARVWSGVFDGTDAMRLVNVISSQTGWLGLEQMVLEAPLRLANTRPAGAFDAYAVSGYFGGILGTETRAPAVRGWIADSRQAAEAAARSLTGEARQDYILHHQYDAAAALAGRELRDGGVSGDATDTLADLLGKTLPYHAEVAQTYGLRLIMYEGGSHVTGIGANVDDPELAAFFIHFNYTPEMGMLYDQLIAGWYQLGGELFNAYADVRAPSKWGSWGALRYLSDQNPRWDALERAR